MNSDLELGGEVGSDFTEILAMGNLAPTPMEIT